MERGWGLSGVTFHAHLETQMADGQQNRFLGVRSFAHLGGVGDHTRGWEGRCGSSEGVGRAMGYTEGVERGWGLPGVASNAHLETQMADGQQNRLPGVRSFAHLGGAGDHTRGWEGRWALQRGGRWAIQRGGRWAIPKGWNVGGDSQVWLFTHTWKRKWLTGNRIGFRV